MDDETILSSHQVARLLQSSPSAVISWFDRGMLEGFRTPGGHRRVKVGELRRFLELHQMPIPRVLLGQAQAPFRIYIVDDEPMVLRTIKRGLELSEYAVEVRGSSNAVEALIAIGADPPDLILLDIYMEEMNGFEVCRQLRQVDCLQEVRIVAMSSQASSLDRERILGCGAQAYLSKPVNIKQLVELMPDEYQHPPLAHSQPLTARRGKGR